MSKVNQYIVIRDGFWWGVIGDAIMYGLLFGGYWLNYSHLGNNGILNIIYTILVIPMIVNGFSHKFKKEFFSPEEAVEYLKTLKAKE